MRKDKGAPADPAAYVAANSLSTDECEAIKAAAGAMLRESNGFSPFEAEIWSDVVEGAGYPPVTFASLVNRFIEMDGRAWSFSRNDGHLTLAYPGAAGDERIADIAEGLAIIRGATVLPVPV